MAEDALVLRMPVNKHHYTSGSAAYAAQTYASGGTVAHGIAHYRTCRNEQSGHLFRQCRQHIVSLVLCQFFTAYHRYVHRQVPYVGRITRTSHYNIVENMPDRVCLCLRFSGCGNQQSNCKNKFFH